MQAACAKAMCLLVLWMLLAASTEGDCRPFDHCSMLNEQNDVAKPETASALLTKNTFKHIDPRDDGEQEQLALLLESDDAWGSSPRSDPAAGCVKCQWRATKDCKPSGSVKMDEDAKKCNEVIGPDSSDVSGFCDCNGNGKLDDSFEQSFNCEDMAKTRVVCGNHCLNVCKIQIYGDEKCASAELLQYFSEVNVSSFGNHPSWRSVRINNPGCAIMFFEDAKAIEQLNKDISKLQAIPGTEQLVAQKRAEIASLQANPFQGTSFRYEGPGCHTMENGENATSAMIVEPCIDPKAPVPTSTHTSTTTTTITTTTTTTCQKCLWQSTNNCRKNGTVNKQIARRTCDQQIGPCSQESGFCDCNGNYKFDVFEIGFNCGELSKEGAVCAKHCSEVCSFQLHSDASCLSSDPQKYYAQVTVQDTGIHTTWNSVSINHKDCNITLFEDTNFAGSSFQYNGSGCYPVTGAKDARSLITLEPCTDFDKPYPTSTSTTTSTTTTCIKCAWRATENCTKDGKVYTGSFQRTCDQEIGKCRHASGFCDCNGNYKLDKDEIGFNCGELANRTVKCGEHCPNVCKWELFDTSDCSTKASATYYADTQASSVLHQSKSIFINLKGCNITLFDQVGFKGQNWRYNDGGCNLVGSPGTTRSLITNQDCMDLNATTTTTTTPCLKCMWRDTNECLATGTLTKNAAKRSCKMELGKCSHLSGFCDCNGNKKLDGDETGFNCGDLKYKYIKCKDYCPNVCVFRFHTDDKCNSSDPLEYYQDNTVPKVSSHSPWKSIWINASVGCKVTLHQESNFKGHQEVHSGVGCRKIKSAKVEDARSFTTFQPCVHQQALVSLNAKTK